MYGMALVAIVSLNSFIFDKLDGILLFFLLRVLNSRRNQE